jgi:phospholipid/cholesterol/gamma-HCH transport system substrate-binding protein
MFHQQRVIEFSVGVFIILGVLSLLYLAFQVSGITGLVNKEAYIITADFTNVGDLKVRAPVSIAGVTVGRVIAIDLEPTRFNAVVTMEIDADEKNIPTDSTANIYTAGIIGANYISITPGFETATLKHGDKITNTNQALILQDLIGQFLFGMKNDKEKEKEKEKNKIAA